MEMIRQSYGSLWVPAPRDHANDNRQTPAWRRSIFPDDAVARIYRPCRAATISGTARTKTWRLVFERRSPPFIEPLMGHTGGDDTLIQVQLEFPSLEAAVGYAERQGLTYAVQMPPRQNRKGHGRLAVPDSAFRETAPANRNGPPPAARRA